MILRLSFVFVMTYAPASLASYHELSMTRFEPPHTLSNDSYFGYSVAYDYQTKSLISSAPRADLEGQVFTCDIRKQVCEKMTVMRPEHIHREDTIRNITHKHHFWLGATVKSDPSSLVVCAPRSSEKMEMFIKPSYGTFGRCFMKQKDRFEIMKILNKEDRKPMNNFRKTPIDSYGWSLNLAKDGSIQIGNPGIFTEWDSSNRLQYNSEILIYDNPKPDTYPRTIAKHLNKTARVYFNFGYSIASGDFFKKDSISLAFGSPYGEIGQGKVIFFNPNGDYIWHINDKQVGSLFGASLCSVALSSDRSQSSLLIGAPAFYADFDRYHTGLVYVYVPIIGTNKMVLRKTIEGPKDGGFFGYAITSIGDIDNDNLDDVAISAPYEDDGRGAVYIYSGADLMRSEDQGSLKWLQRLQPEGFKSFGLSLTALPGFEDNGCNELVVSAPGNDKVALYRCLAAITVDVEARFPNLQERPDKQSFEFASCLKVKYPIKPDKIVAKFEVTVSIMHPNATLANAKINGNEVYIVDLDKSESNPCKPIKVITPVNGDFEKDIQYTITAKLMNDPSLEAKFDKHKVIVNRNSHLSISDSVRVSECKRQDRCQPELSIDVRTSFIDPIYVTGSSSEEYIHIIIKNGNGDTAYRPCVRVEIESFDQSAARNDVTISRAPAHCNVDSVRQRTCQLAGVIQSQSLWDAGNITLDTSLLTNKHQSLKVTVELYNRCNLKVTPDDTKNMTIQLKPDPSGVRIKEESIQGQLVHVKKQDVQYNKMAIDHSYEITNTHGSNWIGLNCDVTLKKEPYLVYSFPIRVYRGGSTNYKTCSPYNETEENYKIKCNLGDLYRRDVITVFIPIRTQPNILDNLLNGVNTTVYTKIVVHVGDEIRNSSVTTRVKLQEEEKLPWWIIPVAIMVALLLIGAIAYALNKLGFLRRKNREKLEELKSEIKRRSTMVPNQAQRRASIADSIRVSLQSRSYKELMEEDENRPLEGPSSTQVEGH